MPQYIPKTKAVDDDHPLEEIASKICEEMYLCSRYTREHTTQKEISSLGFVGRKVELREYMNAALAHITTHHGYDDVKIVGLIV